MLLHGAFSGAASWAQQTPALAAAGFQVFVPERCGHAHTGDVEGPLSGRRGACRWSTRLLPGTHLLPIESPEVVNPLLVQFLRGGPAAVFAAEPGADQAG